MQANIHARTGHDLSNQASNSHFFPDESTTQSHSSLAPPAPSSRQPTRSPSPLTPNSSNQSPPSRVEVQGSHNDEPYHSDSEHVREDGGGFDAWDNFNDEDPDMPSDLRPSFNRQSDGRSYTPLLNSKGENYDGNIRTRPSAARRRSTFRERDPESFARAETKKRYTYAAFFLLLSLISFTVQTETAVYIQHNLKWNKAYCMLYFTHGSWTVLWFLQLLILRIQKWDMPWESFWRRHKQILHQTAQMVQHQDPLAPNRHSSKSAIPYILKTVVFITCALTVAGGSWYLAVDLTTASDLTAIYNCSAFFAYVFSIPLLKERVRLSKVLAVLVAVAGVLVVAYGDSTAAKHGSKSGGGAGGPDSGDSGDSDNDGEVQNRLWGNIIIAVGSVLYGLYEVLYKRLACPPDGTSPGRSMIFANFIGTLIGSFTLTVLWIPLPILHYMGWEVFEWPTGETAWMLAISVFCNAVFSGSFLVLISLTSPVLSSVAALLTIFLVALVDQMLPPPLNSPLSNAAIAGGVLIVVAFVVLSYATYREMDEERKESAKRGDVLVEDSDLESVLED